MLGQGGSPLGQQRLGVPGAPSQCGVGVHSHSSVFTGLSLPSLVGSAGTHDQPTIAGGA